MISLRKHIDDYRGKTQPPEQQAQPESVPEAIVSVETDAPATQADHEAYERLLKAISEAGQKAMPHLAEDFSAAASKVAESANVSLNKAAETAEEEFGEWAERAIEYYQRNEQDVRAIISVLASTSESLVERDQRYSNQIGGLNTGLRKLATNNDLSSMRKSILETTVTLRKCMEKMVEEGIEHQRKLAGQVADYQKRLVEWEQLSKTDALTGLPNRRAFDNDLAARIEGGSPFTVILLDLNDFKVINDTWGHATGDDLLKQLSARLKGQSKHPDLVSRWGGDEFASIIGGTTEEKEAKLQTLRKSLFGSYELATATSTVKIMVEGAVGTADWDGKESAADLLARADANVYAAKPRDRRRGTDRRKSPAEEAVHA